MINVMTDRAGMRTLAAIAAAAIGLGAPGALAQQDAVQVASVADWSERVWSLAKSNNESGLAEALADSPGADQRFTSEVELFKANCEKREQTRAEKIAEVSKQLDEELAKGNDDTVLSHALVAAVELQLLMHDDDAFFTDPRIKELLDETETAARAAEERGDWLVANELYFRLSTMLEKEGAFKEDVDRLTKRLTMIRMYAPERLWQLRNDRRVAEGEDPFPPYNEYGDNFREKLSGIDEMMVRRALQNAAIRYVDRAAGDRDGVDMRQMLVSGVEAIRTMATTTDLQAAFPGLADETKLHDFLASLDSIESDLSTSKNVGALRMTTVLQDLVEANDATVGIMPEAVLHEFGNGAMEKLDPYSAIIWPDELARFRRSTQGEFIGVGIQIQLDELMNIKVVTPLEGTPAQRAGIRAGDIIKKVDGESAAGFTLDQAVEVITGPANTKVTLTIERPAEGADAAEAAEGDTVTKEFTIVRKRIDLPTVKGWEKTGAGDMDWDWFPDDGIGYVRLTGFTEHTTRDFDAAIDQMRAKGLDALILDLRFNPGGLLDQAVSIASHFIDRGLIVETKDADGMPASAPQLAQYVEPSKMLTDIPVIVLINEGSASASEIVSGAIQAAAHQGKVQAIVVGQRSFGKGSVQNVYPLNGGEAAMKLTTQYYFVDSDRIIHRRPGASEWGIDPDLEVEMLPEQITDSILLRRDADVLPIDENGEVIANAERPDPDTLITDGIDLQVQTAVLLLDSQRSARKQTARREN
ncbi:MAG: S41 family peptidase [Phycisphaerales bacterium]